MRTNINILLSNYQVKNTNLLSLSVDGVGGEIATVINVWNLKRSLITEEMTGQIYFHLK